MTSPQRTRHAAVWFTLELDSPVKRLAEDARRVLQAQQIAEEMRISSYEDLDGAIKDFVFDVPASTLQPFFERLRLGNVAAGAIDVYSDEQLAAANSLPERSCWAIVDRRS